MSDDITWETISTNQKWRTIVEIRILRKTRTTVMIPIQFVMVDIVS